MCEDSCTDRKHIQRLTEKRHNLRSMSGRLGDVRMRLEREGKTGINDPLFNLMIVVESMKNYIDAHLDVDLSGHNMTNVKGTNRYKVVHCHHHDCHCDH